MPLPFFAPSCYTIAKITAVGFFMDEIKPGRYRHFKGNEYEVIGLARHSETQEEMVVYRALYGDFGLWVRPARMWNETVERDGKTFRRFTYIGQ